MGRGTRRRTKGRVGAPGGRGRAVVLVLALALVGGCTSVDWMGRLADQSHGSHTPDDMLTAAGVAGLAQKWRLTVPGCTGGASGGEWFATPVTFKGVIYEGSARGCLYAIDEATGTVKWSKFTAFQPQQTCTQQLGIVSSVAVRDDGHGNPLLYFHSSDGYLYKLNGTNGAQIWKALVQVPNSTANDVFAWSSPTVANGKVIVGVSSNCDNPFVQGQVRAYDANTGLLLWAHKTIPDGFVGAGDWYDAAVDGAGNVYVSTGSTLNSIASAHPNTTPGFEQYSILKLNGSTGSLIWKAPAPKYTMDPDYASSPILFVGNGVPMVGATNKDGWFRAYRQDNGAETWQALVGTSTDNGGSSTLSGGVWDGSRLFVMGNASHTGGTWTEGPFPHIWTPQGGSAVAGVIRQLDPATGNIVRVGGRPFELGLPSDPLAPCSINGNGILVCTGGNFNASSTGHDNGVFIVDTTKAAAVLRHLEDRANYSEFAQPVQEHGAILTASTSALIKWAP